jgi:hypothetical protein
LRRARPALGRRTRQQSAALVGVAPLQGDRGTLRGRRMIGGGCAHVRPVLDMRPLVAPRFHPQSNAFYQRLRAAGKRTKVALTACMRKVLTMLNALLKHRTAWQAQEVHNEKIYQAPLTTKTVAPLVPRCGCPARLRRSVAMTSDVKGREQLFEGFIVFFSSMPRQRRSQ